MYVAKKRRAAPSVVPCFGNVKNVPECRNEVSERTPARVPARAHTHTPAHTQRRYTSCKEKVRRLTAGLRTCFHDDQPLAGARPSVRAGSGSRHLPGTGSGAQPRLITRAKLGLRRDCRHLPASLAASLH